MKSFVKQIGMAAGALLLAAIAVGCVTTPEQPYGAQGGLQQSSNALPPVYVPAPAPSSGANAGTSILKVGDPVTINWFDIPAPGIPEYKDKIRDDGDLLLPYNVTVKAAGRTITQLQDDIRTAYVPKYFTHLTISVKPEERFYFVGGEVKIPSRQLYVGEMTVLRAIDTAGGFTDFANRKNIELRRVNGQSLKVNWQKAMEKHELDLPVYPNDQIIVRKRIW